MPRGKQDEERLGAGGPLPEQTMHEEPVLPPPTVELEEPQTPEDKKTHREKIEDERFIRGRVRRIGGFVRGISDREKAAAVERLAKYGRTVEAGWDNSIYIEGYDNCSHAKNHEDLDERRRKKARERELGL